MKPELYFLLAGCVCLTGCASTDLRDRRESPVVKPGLVLLTPEQAQARTRFAREPEVIDPPPAQPLDASAVIIPDDIEAFTVNRRVDPADPDVLHEQHVVYRRSKPRWRLSAAADQRILVGPRLTDGRQELQPILTKELTSFLVDQRRATEANREAIATMYRAIEALTKQQQALAAQARERQEAAGPVADATQREAQTQAEKEETEAIDKHKG